MAIDAPALARDWPETAGWDIVEGDDFCLMHMEYEGPGDSSLAIALYQDGRVLISDVNYGWSAEKEQIYPEVSFALNGESYTGAAVGVEILGKKGFAMKFGGEILADIAAAQAVRVYKGDTLIDRLSLGGSSSALAMTKRCLAAVRTAHADAERERKRWADLPKDPFAGETGSKAVSARGNPADWISNDDYPASALRNEEEGSVGVTFNINPRGRIENCTVTSSSGSRALDDATCRLLTSRGRYSPALGSDGNAIASTGSFRFQWSIHSK
ncbi:energy transducer TonB [Sphingomonas sp. IC-56]|nr:energy transducer TonB [Sphingomonas sp. IC-56]